MHLDGSTDGGIPVAGVCDGCNDYQAFCDFSPAFSEDFLASYLELEVQRWNLIARVIVLVSELRNPIE